MLGLSALFQKQVPQLDRQRRARLTAATAVRLSTLPAHQIAAVARATETAIATTAGEETAATTGAPATMTTITAAVIATPTTSAIDATWTTHASCPQSNGNARKTMTEINHLLR